MGKNADAERKRYLGPTAGMEHIIQGCGALLHVPFQCRCDSQTDVTHQRYLLKRSGRQCRQRQAACCNRRVMATCGRSLLIYTISMLANSLQTPLFATWHAVAIRSPQPMAVNPWWNRCNLPGGGQKQRRAEFSWHARHHHQRQARTSSYYVGIATRAVALSTSDVVVSCRFHVAGRATGGD